MKHSEHIIVRGNDGLQGTIDSDRRALADEHRVMITLAQGGRVLVPASLLLPQPDGSLRLNLALNELENYRVNSDSQSRDAPFVLPLAKEELRIDRQRIETGKIVINKTVHEHEVITDEPVISEEVQVERVQVNREVDKAPSMREEGGVLIIPLIEEVLEVRKKLFVREELRITRRRVQSPSQQRITLRSEQAHVERAGGAK